MLEKLREYLDLMPILSEEVDAEMENMEYDATNSEQLRGVREEAQHTVCAHLKAEGKCYRVLFFTNYTLNCAEADCDEKLVGAYVEINNPVTSKGMYLNHLLFHQFTQHDQLFVNEPNLDMSLNQDGTRRLELNLVGLLKVLDGSAVPADIEREVSAYFAAKSA